MLYVFYFYVFFLPLQYIQEKIPKGPTGVNYANVMMILMALGWIFHRLARGRRVVLPSPLNLPMALFLAWTYFGVVWGTLSQPEVTFEMGNKFYLQFANGFLMFWFALHLLGTRRAARGAIFAIALVAPLVFRVFYSQLHSILVWHYRDDLRINGPFVYVGSNELGAFFVYAAIFLLIYAFWRQRLWQRLYFLGAAAMYIYGILFSYSRGSQLAFIVALGLAASVRYRFVLLLMAVAWLTMPMWVPPSVKDRWDMTEQNGQLDPSAASRSTFWKVAWDIFLEHPVTGSGLGTFKILNPYHMDAHNIYMRVLAEQGAIGLGLLVAIWVTILRIAHLLWRRAPEPHDRHVGFCLLIATLGLMIANVFGDRFSHYVMIGQFWVLVGLAARLYAGVTGVEALEDESESAEEIQPKAEGAPGVTAAAAPRLVGAAASPAPALAIRSGAAPEAGLRRFARRALNLLGRAGGEPYRELRAPSTERPRLNIVQPGPPPEDTVRRDRTARPGRGAADRPPLRVAGRDGDQ
ncbi:MAG: O-antigen ligase family protein [bacterium]|nr:O-antigen ligase family protein [bacterium]